MTLNRFSATRVERRLLGGNSSPVVVATKAGRFVLELRGAGHGVLALVAEIIVAALAERLGLPVPERALIELPEGLPSDDANDELADLLQRSMGLNLGFRLLDGAQCSRVSTPSSLVGSIAARFRPPWPPCPTRSSSRARGGCRRASSARRSRRFSGSDSRSRDRRTCPEHRGPGRGPFVEKM